jgi:hypothetical protein
MSALKVGAESEIQVYGPPGRFSEGSIGMVVAQSLLTKRVKRQAPVNIQDIFLEYAVQKGKYIMLRNLA